jgi:hypothetical protein
MAQQNAMGSEVVTVRWVANPFRGDRFQELWAPVAERVLDFGAKGHAFLRMREDKSVFTQLAFFDDKLDWERYWLSEEVSDARIQLAGLYQVPVLPQWHSLEGFGSLATSPVAGAAGSDGSR